MFVLDEAGKHKKLRFMIQKNILIMDIQLIRHYDAGFIGACKQFMLVYVCFLF